jgi:bifunctional non-homologous end joining protein LigD
MSLKTYKKKRDFTVTGEPRASRTSGGGGHHFVIQKHDASRLHYDFRLEMGGALKSWAVPKGIPLAKGEKRLAVHVEDHPISYMRFEGVIPKGQYGGGTVMVWDIGTFELLEAGDVDSGNLHFVLHGKKLEGAWRLVRMRDGDQWLLIRSGNDMRTLSKKMDDTSALSGKTMKQLAANGGAVLSKNPSSRQPRKPAKKPLKFIEPMMARLLDRAPAGEWLYEIKFDGFRAIALLSNGNVRLFSRNEKDFSGKFGEVRDALARLDVQDAIIDGEIVALDARGRSSFQLLQRFELGQARPPLFYYAFDLPRLNGKDLTHEPLARRTLQLEQILKNAPETIRYSSALGEDAGRLLPRIRKLGLEGLIGKRKDSPYEPGRRSGAWIKLKLHQEQEMVIGGYTDPEGARTHFGALLIGFHENKKLIFAGKVGTGFNEAILESLHSRFEKIASKRCPFANLPETGAGQHRQNITAAAMKRCHWVKPELVCQVRFSEWTQDGKLRQPVYLGLREDKAAAEVVREKAATPTP